MTCTGQPPAPPGQVAPTVLSSPGIDTDPIHVPPLVLWPAEGQCFVDRRRVVLNRRAFELLVDLAAAAGHVVPRARLYERVWGHTIAGRQRDVDVYMAKLRNAAPAWSFIHTHPKYGHRLSPEMFV
jgi:DNA-binding response OmpR family regulator